MEKTLTKTYQPQSDVQLEQVVLGSMLIEQGAEAEALPILSDQSFFDEKNSLVFKAIRQLSTANQPIDMYTVVDRLSKNGDLDTVGGAYYVASLTEKVGSAAHIEFHSRILQQKLIARELLRLGDDLTTKATDTTQDVDELLSFAEQAIYNIQIGNIQKDVQTFGTLLQQSTKRLEAISEKLANNPDALTGVPSGFRALDKITAGWQPSDLVIVAARPAMGKTAFVVSMAMQMAQNHRIPVLIFSLEMSALQLTNRIVSQQTGIYSDKLKSGQLTEYDWQQYDRCIGSIQDMPLYIDDTASISLFQLRSKTIRMKQQHNIGCIMIDYLQLMTTGQREFRGNREQEVSTISRGLKQIAKELDIPVIVLSQLSRNTVQNQGDLTPKLHHLRDSGAIEQDADIVTFIHRPEYYGIKTDDLGNPSDGLAQIIIAKNRSGATTTVPLRYIPELTKFTDYDNI